MIPLIYGISNFKRYLYILTSSFIVYDQGNFSVLIMSNYRSSISLNTHAPAGMTRAQFLNVCYLSLETLEWEGYEGRKKEKEVAAFILRSGRCLKNVTISSTSTDSDKKLEMLKELSFPSGVHLYVRLHSTEVRLNSQSWVVFDPVSYNC